MGWKIGFDLHFIVCEGLTVIFILLGSIIWWDKGKGVGKIRAFFVLEVVIRLAEVSWFKRLCGIVDWLNDWSSSSIYTVTALQILIGY